jgi:preprotein translocase subunit SecD
MGRRKIWMACLAAILFASAMQAQAQFSIRAASAEPIEGWQRMQVEHSNRVVWVAPTAAVIASDIEKAQPEITPDGNTRIAVVFTDAGARKIRDLTTAQRKKLIALVVGDKLIWAPIVQQPLDGREGVLTGNGPNGLTQEEVERIMASLR